MKRDLYLEWINNEVLEKGFREPLWSRLKEEAKGDEIAAKGLYLEKRKEQLIESDFKLPVFEAEGTISRVPHRTEPPDFVDLHPTLLRSIGFAISIGLILLGFWVARKYGLG